MSMAVLFALLLPWMPLAQQGGPVCFEDISLDDGPVEISGRWEDACPSLSQSGRPAKYFTFIVSDSPRRVQLSLRPDSLNTFSIPRLFLRQQSPGMASPVAESPLQNFQASDAHIEMFLPPGTYTVEATTVRSITPEFYDTFSFSAQTLESQCQFDVALGEDGGPREFFHEWTPGCRSLFDETSYALRYSMGIPEGGKVVEISLNGGEVDSLLLVSRAGEFDPYTMDDDGGDGHHALIRSFFSEGEHLVEATTILSETVGPFHLSFSPLGEEGSVESSIQAPCRVSVSLPEDMATLTDTRFLHRECPSLIQGQKHAFYYVLELEDEGPVHTLVSSEEVDTFLRILDTSGQVLEENDDYGSSTDSAISTTLSPGRYLIEVTTFNERALGDFTFSLSSNPIDPDDLTIF